MINCEVAKPDDLDLPSFENCLKNRSYLLSDSWCVQTSCLKLLRGNFRCENESGAGSDKSSKSIGMPKAFFHGFGSNQWIAQFTVDVLENLTKQEFMIESVFSKALLYDHKINLNAVETPEGGQNTDSESDWSCRAVFHMDQHSGNMTSSSGSVDGLSDTESLTNALDDTETLSLVESVGSVEVESSRSRKPEIRRSREDEPPTKFLQFRAEMRNVPVQAAWKFIRSHERMANVVPGIVESLNYLEGDGGTGSVFVGIYNLKCVRPGEEKYIINNVEFSDDSLRLYALRCVAGKYMRLYSDYLTFIQVLPDDVLGDSSSVVEVRVEYCSRKPDRSTPRSTPEDSRFAYTTALHLIKNEYMVANRLGRQILTVQAAKRSTTRAHQYRKDFGEQEAANSPRRTRKLKLVTIDDEEMVPQHREKERSKQRPAPKASIKLLGGETRTVRRNERPSECFHSPGEP